MLRECSDYSELRHCCIYYAHNVQHLNSELVWGQKRWVLVGLTVILDFK